MELFEQIEATRFLGREWLLYLWYESERMDRDHPDDAQEDATAAARRARELFSPAGVDPFSLYVTAPLVLESRFDVVERVSIAGTEPSESAEARAALREGKLPAKLKVEVQRGEREWVCTIDGDTLALSGVKLPAELSKDDETALEERLYLMEELEQMLDALLREYVELRLSRRFARSVTPALRAWIHDDEA